MEVIFDELDHFGVGPLGIRDLPGRFIKTDFSHPCPKPAISDGPIDAWRKVFPRDALPPPLALVCPFLLFLRILRGLLGSSRRCYLGRQAGAWLGPNETTRSTHHSQIQARAVIYWSPCLLVLPHYCEN